MLTHARLLQILTYDASTGLFRWRFAPNGRVPKGSIAGSPARSGHLRLKIARQTHQLHRLAWFYVHAEWPAGEVDHIDCNPANNAIANLRVVDRKTNAQNVRRAHTHSKTGVLGVTRDGSKYRATISSEGRKIHVGNFESAALAYQAYVEAKRRLHAGCTL